MKIKLFLSFLLFVQFLIPTIAQVNSIPTDTSFKHKPLKTTGLSSSELGIYNWFENYPSATVLTFDDYSPGHPAIGIPDLIAHGLTGTFFVTINNMWTSDEYNTMKNAVDKGIEIGNHTISHPYSTSLSPTDLNKEIKGAYDSLNKYVTNQSVYTFAYPYGDYNDDVINAVKKNHIAARIVNQPWTGGWYYNFAQSINDYYTIFTVAVNANTSKSILAQHVEDGINDGGLITFMIHSIYNNNVDDSWFDAIHQDLYNELLDTLKHYSDQTWITTFSNAIRYHKEANSASVNVVSDNRDETILSLTDTLSDNLIYNQPLSLYYSPTVKSAYTSVMQNGTALPFKQNNGIITFNAIPDGGNIILTKDVNTAISDPSAIANVRIYPMPTNGSSTLEFYVNASDIYSYKLIDIQGKVIYSSPSVRSNDSGLIRSELLAPSKGFYLIEIQINEQIKTIKMIVE